MLVSLIYLRQNGIFMPTHDNNRLLKYILSPWQVMQVFLYLFALFSHHNHWINQRYPFFPKIWINPFLPVWAHNVILVQRVIMINTIRRTSHRTVKTQVLVWPWRSRAFEVIGCVASKNIWLTWERILYVMVVNLVSWLTLRFIDSLLILSPSLEFGVLWLYHSFSLRFHTIKFLKVIL